MLVAALISLSALATSPAWRPEPVPPPLTAEAQKVVDGYEKSIEDARKIYDKATTDARGKAIRELEILLDRYTKAGKLDEAVATRDRIRDLKGVLAASSWKAPTDADIGHMVSVVVTGSTAGGQVWGVGPYTSDSDPSVAAVHDGIVKPGERAELTIEIMPGRPSYESSTRNGVTTQAYGSWSPSYRFARRPE